MSKSALKDIRLVKSVDSVTGEAVIDIYTKDNEASDVTAAVSNERSTKLITDVNDLKESEDIAVEVYTDCKLTADSPTKQLTSIIVDEAEEIKVNDYSDLAGYFNCAEVDGRRDILLINKRVDLNILRTIRRIRFTPDNGMDGQADSEDKAGLWPYYDKHAKTDGNYFFFFNTRPDSFGFPSSYGHEWISLSTYLIMLEKNSKLSFESMLKDKETNKVINNKITIRTSCGYITYEIGDIEKFIYHINVRYMFNNNFYESKLLRKMYLQ